LQRENNNKPDIVHLSKDEPVKKVKQTWLNVIIKDDEGKPVPNQKFVVTFDNGHSIKGQVNENGFAHLDPVPEGKHQIELLDVDRREWSKE